MVLASHLLHLIEVNLSDQRLDFILGHCKWRIPDLANEAVDLEGTIDVLELIESALGDFLGVPHELHHSLEFVVLTLKVQIHHFQHEVQPLLQQLHTVLLHGVVQFREVPFD